MGSTPDYGEIVAGPYRADVRGPASTVGTLLAFAAVFLGLGGYFMGGALARPRGTFFTVAGRESVYPFLFLVSGLGALFFGGLMFWHSWVARHDRVELRRDGLVRISRHLGTKHFHYADIATIETKRTDAGAPWAVRVTTRDDVFVAISHVHDLASLERELRARCPDLASPV